MAASTSIGRIAFVVGAAAAAALTPATAWAAGAPHAGTGGSGAGAPPGNNGTVKIDETTVDPGSDNDPHVACGFSVSFFGYDSGAQQAAIAVTPVAPTGGGSTYRTSTTWQTANRTSGDQFDAAKQISAGDLSGALTGVTPQPQQGYHLRLEVEVTGSQGSDDKFKTFWMSPCTPSSSPSAGSSASIASASSGAGSATSASGGRSRTPGTVTADSSSTEATSTGAPVTGAAVSTGLAGADVAAPGPSPTRSAASVPSVAAVTAAGAGSAPAAATSGAAAPGSAPATWSTASGRIVTAASSAPAAAEGSLPFTGADVVPMVGVGVGLIGTGGLLVRGRRRRARRA
ncbi:MAG TPA: hypothetical protein VFP61_14440 [Acidimicrobiales bacterium]|nr:hypothetical protein [Acidimicrobiales bacterium]